MRLLERLQPDAVVCLSDHQFLTSLSRLGALRLETTPSRLFQKIAGPVTLLPASLIRFEFCACVGFALLGDALED